MGKHNGNKIDTQVLYKKSNITIRTHSRTCSDASQLARSGIMQLKKTMSKTNDYYTEGDKVKRDLGVETAFCILRRYYKSKHKRDKCSVPPSTVKSKCSTMSYTEIDSDECKPDESACGDSRKKFEIVNQINPTNIDITSMMVENLKGLLHDWIKKHVLEDTETKKKLINVLDSILQCLEAKISSRSSSCSTYIVERNGEGYKVRNKKTATNSITCQYCKQKQMSLITKRSSSVLFRKYSRLTIPFPYRHLRIISTLSIPRNLYRKDKTKKKEMVYKFKKPPKKNAESSSNKKEKKVVINVSSCETSPASKNSIIRSSKTNEKFQIKKRGLIFVPTMFYKSTTEYTSTTEVEDANAKNKDKKHIHLDTMPSLVKSIYADDPANVTSTDKVLTHQDRNDNFTMTEIYHPSVKVGNSTSNVRFHEAKYECCKSEKTTSKTTHKNYESHSNFGYINQSIEFPHITVPKQILLKHSKQTTPDEPKLRKKTKISCYRRSHRRHHKYENIKYKHFTYLYKKTNSERHQANEFLNHFRNVFKYFANYEGKRNIKLEIHCNVHPLFEAEEKISHVDHKEILNFVQMTPENVGDTVTLKMSNAIAYEDKSDNNIEASQLNPEIIPLLDGAVSQAAYIFKSDNSINKSQDTVNYKESTDQGTIMTGLEASCADTVKYIDSIDRGTVMTSLEVSKELKELKIAIRDLSATAEMMVIEHFKIKAGENPSSNLTSNMAATVADLENINEKTFKRSTISKSVQITNTSTKGQFLSGIKLSKEPKKVEEFSNTLKKTNSSYHVIDSESILKVTDMTSSANKPKVGDQSQLRKSKSLLQITTEDHKQRLLAFFCDRCKKNNDIICSFGGKQQPSPINASSPKRSNASLENKLYIPVKISQDSYQGHCGHEYCSSAYVDIEKPTITVKKRSGLPFWEGCLYCILLWIPLIVIMYLYYDFVLKDHINKPPPSNDTKKLPLEPSASPLGIEQNHTKTSRFLLKLSDFGF